jgi:hypothetical protein
MPSHLLITHLPHLQILKTLHLSGNKSITNEIVTSLLQYMPMMENLSIINCQNVREILEMPSLNYRLKMFDIGWNMMMLDRFSQLQALEYLIAEGLASKNRRQ